MATESWKLFTPAAMDEIDRRAISGGIDSAGLMRRAGAAVAASALAHWPEVKRAVVLCGPGNNGADGHVAARLLSETGVLVSRYGVEPVPGSLSAIIRKEYPGKIQPLSTYEPLQGDLVIDALFGAGLARPLKGDFAEVAGRIARKGVPVLAIDLPSGISGNSGKVLREAGDPDSGTAVRAERTITFAGLKPGHLLMPGREFCGILELVDIGIPARLLVSDDPLWRNGPALYGENLPVPAADTHKYRRGHLGVFSGPLIAGGASRLAATAGLKIGAGLVTLATPPGAILGQAAHLTAIMQHRMADADDLAEWFQDRRLSAFVIGPGFGDKTLCAAYVEKLAADGRPLVLDADALSAFAGQADTLGNLFAGKLRLVITPHEGEFYRLLGDTADNPEFSADTSKVDLARNAAKRINSVVVFKGPDTVIAAPDGRAAINDGAPALLATAGSGDVLAGMIGGLLAQGMPAFEAACAGVDLHGKTALEIGAGMSAEDLLEHVGRSWS